MSNFTMTMTILILTNFKTNKMLMNTRVFWGGAGFHNDDFDTENFNNDILILTNLILRDPKFYKFDTHNDDYYKADFENKMLMHTRFFWGGAGFCGFLTDFHGFIIGFLRGVPEKNR